MNPMDLKAAAIDLAVEAIVAGPAKKKLEEGPPSNDEDRPRSATISANGDSEIGRFLAEAMKKVGKRGA